MNRSIFAPVIVLGMCLLVVAGVVLHRMRLVCVIGHGPLVFVVQVTDSTGSQIPGAIVSLVSFDPGTSTESTVDTEKSDESGISSLTG